MFHRHTLLVSNLSDNNEIFDSSPRDQVLPSDWSRKQTSNYTTQSDTVI